MARRPQGRDVRAREVRSTRFVAAFELAGRPLSYGHCDGSASIRSGLSSGLVRQPFVVRLSERKFYGTKSASDRGSR